MIGDVRPSGPVTGPLRGGYRGRGTQGATGTVTAPGAETGRVGSGRDYTPPPWARRGGETSPDASDHRDTSRSRGPAPLGVVERRPKGVRRYARGGIRTHGPLRERILSPPPLSRLGHPRLRYHCVRSPQMGFGWHVPESPARFDERPELAVTEPQVSMRRRRRADACGRPPPKCYGSSVTAYRQSYVGFTRERSADPTKAPPGDGGRERPPSCQYLGVFVPRG